jgi:hypothetical protein
MGKLWRKGLPRLGLVAGGTLLAMALSSCVGGLPVTVNSVTGTLEPYNPQTGDQGIPAEQVDFTVGDYTFGSSDLWCLIGVHHDGQLVGSTFVEFGSRTGTPSPGGVEESDPVNVSLSSPFNGTPSDATVGCVA